MLSLVAIFCFILNISIRQAIPLILLMSLVAALLTAEAQKKVLIYNDESADC